MKKNKQTKNPTDQPQNKQTNLRKLFKHQTQGTAITRHSPWYTEKYIYKNKLLTGNDCGTEATSGISK